jgi:hypothetical protein
VITSALLPLWPLVLPNPADPITPLHEVIKKAVATSKKAKNFLNFIPFATTALGWHPPAIMTGNRGLSK